MSEDEYLFDPCILEGLSKTNLDDDLILRPLRQDDFSKGFIQLLSQLTKVGDIDHDAYLHQFKMMKESKMYYILVVEDIKEQRIIATTTLFLEYKFIHQCGLRARIEDVVVSQSHRGQKLGSIIVKCGVELSKKLNCYKVSLDCRDSLISFYQSLGFLAEAGRTNMLVQRFSD